MPLELFVRGQCLRIRRATGLLRGDLFDADELKLAAALPRLRAVPFVGEEMFERRQQEGAELAALAPGVPQVILLQEPDEETLCQVFGFRRRVASSSQKSVNRRPVGAEQFRQSLLGFGRRTPPGGQHQAPLRRSEAAGSVYRFPVRSRG